MTEKDTEKYLVNKVKTHNGLAWKFTSPGNAGVPDRIVVFPSNRICFIEVKAAGKKLRPLQEQKISALRRKGCKVYVVDTKEAVDRFIDEVSWV